MIQLREPVIVKTGWGEQELRGELYVGDDGLPTLRIRNGVIVDICHLWTFPAAWSLRSLPDERWGILRDAWEHINMHRGIIRDAQREAEHEHPTD